MFLTNFTTTNLEKAGYVVHQSFHHQNMVSFLRQNLNRLSYASVYYWMFNLSIITGIFLKGIDDIIPLDKVVMYFFLGIFLMVVLIPLHEAIHGLFYKLAGAPKVTYAANWKKMIFYAAADKFVVNRYAFIILALAPFIIINSLLLYLIAVTPDSVSWFLCGTLFIHTGGCAGDFALLNYFVQQWQSDPVTYDDLEQSETYFLIKTKQDNVV